MIQTVQFKTNQQDQPSLSRALIDGKVVFIFGAGASMDCGFPSWHGRKECYANAVNVEPSASLPSISTIRRWLKAWETGDNSQTIDELVYAESDQDAKIDRTFQKLTANIIGNFEMIDRGVGWIEQFSSVIADIIRCCKTPDEIKEILSKIRFVSLNYDRVFEFHYMKNGMIWRAIREKFATNHSTNSFIKRNLIDHFSIEHPHGVIGELVRVPENGKACSVTGTSFSDETVIVDYGASPEIYMIENHSISVVGHSNQKYDASYIRVNQLIEQASNIFVMGLSPYGFSQARLKFPPSKNVWFWSPACEGFKEILTPMRLCLGYSSDFAKSLVADCEAYNYRDWVDYT